MATRILYERDSIGMGDDMSTKPKIGEISVTHNSLEQAIKDIIALKYFAWSKDTGFLIQVDGEDLGRVSYGKLEIAQGRDELKKLRGKNRELKIFFKAFPL